MRSYVFSQCFIQARDRVLVDSESDPLQGTMHTHIPSWKHDRVQNPSTGMFSRGMRKP